MNGGGWMHPTISAILLIPSLHLHQSATSSFLKPIFLILPSTCSLHFILGHPCLCFLSTLCTIAFIKTSSQVVSKHDHTISHHSPFPAYLLLPSIPTCPLASLYSSCSPTIHTYCSHHRSFCFSQKSYFIFSQTPCFTSI